MAITCETCRCVNHMHGDCESRGHGPDCHGVHTIYFCETCECCMMSAESRVTAENQRVKCNTDRSGLVE